MDFEPSYSATSIEGMFVRGLGDQLTPGVRAELKAMGVDLDRPPKAAYPQALWEAALKHAVEAAFPSRPRTDAYFEAGRLYMQGFTNTLLGSAVVQLGKLIGPERTFGRMVRNQRTTNNFSALTIEKLGPTHFVFHASVDPPFLPGIKAVPGFEMGAFVSGIYFGVMTLLGLKNPKVTHRALNEAEYRFDYELSWDG